jgi:membrane-associated phospholipid phosphatase
MGHMQLGTERLNRSRCVYVLTACAFILLALGLGLSLGDIGKRLALWAHGSPVLPEMFWASLTLLGAGWAVVIIVAAFDRAGGAFVLAALGSVLLGGGLVKFIKDTWPIARPSHVMSPDQLAVIGEVVTRAGSMPSGHAAAATALATLVILFLGVHKRLTLSMLMALLVAGGCAAWSRFAVGAHWPADVAVGAALGILTAQVCFLAVTRLRAYAASVVFSYRVRMMAVAMVELVVAAACFADNTGQPSAWLMQYALGCVALVSCVLRLRQIAFEPHAQSLQRI